MTTSPLTQPAASATASGPLLEVQGLNVYYGESHILRNVDLNVKSGQMVCLIGRNGVGKTTLLKTVVGLLRQRSGSVVMEDREVSRLPPHQRARAGIGYVPQGREIIPQLTVRENLLLGMEARPGGLAKHRHIDPLVFELFPVLEKFLARRGGDLSGGQQQQLAIARALLGKPKLLLLDEPTEGIQPSVVLDIERAVRRIIETTGISVLLVEQHLHFVRQADWYYAMQKGGVVASGPTEELSKQVIDRFLSV
ncbi:urea ABC transporter ATP-binding subunit UrtE [Synechococcus sp. CCY9201]|uniref:urea ABC transporter ATP-binding subunit UrtE n=1 Tax=Synechococcus sp. CCY9201 TaxID=174697 RepID=UPI002B1EFB00|nr:urea ABC transporter ATP-binding subunit UrtE [Synechococcus sp. CCY9201]MEA5474947.1 urea ABC transporter ATP-binding subunit UrtE [Synechococcus sp. CCY9201]